MFSTFGISLCRMPEKKTWKRGEKESGMALSQVSYSEVILSLSFLKWLFLDSLIVSDSGVSSVSCTCTLTQGLL